MAAIITAHISNVNIKICEISHSSKETVIQRIFKVDTPEGTVEDGKILDMERLAAYMSAEMARESIAAKEIIFVLDSSRIVMKEVYTPALKPAKLDDMIKANASDYFPVNIDDYIVTEKIVSKVASESGEKQLRVNVFAAPKDMIESYYQLAEKLGLTVKNIESYGNATVALLKRQIGSETSIVIQVRDDSTVVNIFKNNILEFQRTVPYGKNIVIQTLMEERNVDEEAAEEILAKERILHSSFDGDEVTESLRYLVNSIVRVVEFYTSRNSDSPVEKAYLTGESVSLVGLEDLFATEFDFSVTPIMSFQGFSFAPYLHVGPKSVSHFISCAGAVMEPVNFQPETVAGVTKKDKSVTYLLIGAVASLVAGVILIAIPGIQNLSVNSDISDMEEKIDKIKDVEVVVDAYYNATDKLKDMTTFLDIATNPNDYMLDFLYALEKGQPSDVSIKSMTVANGQVSISATTSTKQTIAKFITQLKSMPGVTGVYVSSDIEQKDEYGVVSSSFGIICTFDSRIESYIAPQEESVAAEGETETTAEEEEQ